MGVVSLQNSGNTGQASGFPLNRPMWHGLAGLFLSSDQHYKGDDLES